MKINVIIPNYNGADLISKNLPSVLDSLKDYSDSIITIVDDGSEEKDYQKLKDFVSGLNNKIKIDLVRYEKNKGFSSAVNKGALASDAELLVILNSDVSPEEGFLAPVIKDFEENDNLFGVGCLDKSEEEEGIVLRGRGVGFWKRGFVVHKKGEADKSDTFWLSGGSSIIRAKLFKSFGGYDEIYNPFYWEDIDLSYRARKAGYDIKFENKSVVTHRHSEGSIRKHYSKSSITKISYRNQFIFVWKNITDTVLIFSHFVFLPYHMLKAVLRFDLAFFEGLSLAVMRLPDIIKRRNKQKDENLKKDFELFSKE
ncbi:MAG: Glycosyl transferase, family 2 [Microgenomates group bacterium GW2011_GWA2_37_6]|nr:MAG: Glycosyl transferase, family 2 [Microgenomates group bacterium GW2011_GWA2_37_6]